MQKKSPTAVDSDDDLIANEHLSDKHSPTARLGKYHRKPVPSSNVYKRKTASNQVGLQGCKRMSVNNTIVQASKNLAERQSV